MIGCYQVTLHFGRGIPKFSGYKNADGPMDAIELARADVEIKTGRFATKGSAKRLGDPRVFQWSDGE